jgi:two-component system KDP operon response regulator KdpE
MGPFSPSHFLFGKVDMPNPKILLIDDDPTLLELLSDHIRATGYDCIVAQESALGLKLAEESKPDLIVLDVMMPDMDGWTVCRRLREFSQVPIIMLTAKGEEVDKLHGFRLGVDDYVTKPFSFAEMVARIGAVLSRTKGNPTNTPHHVLESGDLVIDFDKHHITLAGKPVDLTPTEYRLLEMLVQNAYRVVTTEQLLRGVWGPEYEGQVDQVKHYIWSLRKKIEHDPGDPQHIITERGFGYYFE